MDFTLVDFRTRVTGIPRVAYAYLEAGYQLEKELGIDVLPVYVKNGKIVDARSLLIQSGLRSFRQHPSLKTLFGLIKAISFFVLHGLRLLLVTAVVPFLALATFLFSFSFFDFWKDQMQKVFKRVYFALKDGINAFLARPIETRPGDILFMPAYWHDTPPGFYTRLRAEGVVICPLVHDILPITHAAHYQSPWREQFKVFVGQVLRDSSHVYYISEVTRQAVAEVNDSEYGIRLPPGTVIHHGYDFGQRPSPTAMPRSAAARSILARGQPYFLMVGSIEPKKNHLKVVREFEKLWLKGVSANLVIVGGAGWKDAKIRQTLERNPHLHASLIWLSSVDDGDLAILYQRAAGLIQASEAEGFGLPIVEALSFGTSVLTNDIPVFREVGGDHVTYFEIDREGSLGAKVEAMLPIGPKPVAAFIWPTWLERARVLFQHMLTVTSRPQKTGASASEPPTPKLAAN